MIDPQSVRLFVPPGLKGFKQDLFDRIAKKIGGEVRYDFHALRALSDDLVPAIGCTPELRPLVLEWRKRSRKFIYWDRGYARRVFATWLDRGENGGYYRWHINSFQMPAIRNRPADRWEALKTPVDPWAKGGRHIVVAAGSPTYERYHGIEGWTARTVDLIRKYTDRPITISDKESKIPLRDRIRGAHCLVSHGSNAAVEAVIMGCPVFVDPCSAAALVGKTDLAEIEQPSYPDREAWLRSLAYCQFNEDELVDGTLWRLIE